MSTYEVGIYNKWVRDKIRNGEEPPGGLEAEWENVYYFEVEALSEDKAKARIAEQYPFARGFIIESVQKVGS